MSPNCLYIVSNMALQKRAPGSGVRAGWSSDKALSSVNQLQCYSWNQTDTGIGLQLLLQFPQPAASGSGLEKVTMGEHRNLTEIRRQFRDSSLGLLLAVHCLIIFGIGPLRKDSLANFILPSSWPVL